MKKIVLLFVLIILTGGEIFSQRIGKEVPNDEKILFPKNTLGLDLMIGEGGFGLGGFYRRELAENLTFFTDFSISESKDEKEVEYIDYFGRIIVMGKKNRIFQVPFNFGLQYRLFSESLTDNLRPYINAGFGPSLVFTTPFEKEFFSAFGSATTYLAAGGYVGMGANFGLNRSSVVGINLRYYVIKFFDGGVEGMTGRNKETIGGFFLTINIGTMY